MSVHISNYLVLCVFISLASGAEPQGYTNINYNRYNNYGYNERNKNEYENKGINLPQLISNLPEKLMSIPYSLIPTDLGYQIGKYLVGVTGQIENKGYLYPGQVENKNIGGYVGYQRPSTKKPDFSNEPSTTVAPLNEQQKIYLSLLDAIVGKPDARESLLKALNLG